jgi:hypothetical protein
MLAGIVEHPCEIALAVRKGDDLLKGLALEVGVPLDEAIESGHVSLMVLAVMQLERFLAHAPFG